MLYAMMKENLRSCFAMAIRIVVMVREELNSRNV